MRRFVVVFGLISWAIAGCSQSSSNGGTSQNGSSDATLDSTSLDTSAADSKAGGDTLADTSKGPDASATDSDTTSTGNDTAGSDTQPGDTSTGDTSGTDAGPKPYNGAPIAIENFTKAFVQGTCQTMVECGVAGSDLSFATVQGCVALLESSGSKDFATMVAAVQGGSAKYDDVAAGKCLAQATSTCLLGGDISGYPDCIKTFTGTIADGKACKVDIECVSQNCASAVEGCPTVCTAVKAAGAACQAGDKCAPGNKCLGGTCVDSAPKAVGGPCSGDQDCKADLWCQTVSEGSAGVCAAKVALGAACSSDLACANGLYCDASVAQPTCKALATAGQACSNFGMGGAKCVKGYTCAGSGTSGTCVKSAGPGEACQVGQCYGIDMHCKGTGAAAVCALLPVKGEACQPADITKGEVFACLGQAVCVDKVCADPPGLGQPCSAMSMNPCAPGLVCGTDNTCAKPAGEGQPCNGGCATGLTCSDADGKCHAPVCS